MKLKTVDCSVTEDFLFIYINRGKEGMDNRRYHLKIGATTLCTKIMKEATKVIGQRYIKGTTKDFFLSEIWFDSNNFPEAVMGVGAEIIGMV